MLDWLSASLPWTAAGDVWHELRDRADRICRYNPSTGETYWETAAWDSVRSDSHQVLVYVGADSLRIQGSPARCIGDGDAVFGAGASAALDLSACLVAMVRHVCTALGVVLPMHPKLWKVTRVDVTENLLLESLDEVRAALRVLRDCEGGRYRVSQQAGDTVYWSHKSTLRSGKAYAKGPHLKFLSRKKDYNGREYSPAEVDAACRLLRLELKLARHWWDRHDKPWWAVSAGELRNAWSAFFELMVGDVSMNDNDKLRLRCIAQTTERQGAAAYGTYLLIQDMGYERARSQLSHNTWYRHLRILRAAGLGDADISAGRIVEFRRVLAARPVISWDELRAA